MVANFLLFFLIFCILKHSYLFIVLNAIGVLTSIMFVLLWSKNFYVDVFLDFPSCLKT